MPDLVSSVLARVRQTEDLDSALAMLLSLDGYVPSELTRRALTSRESAGLAARFERRERLGGPPVFAGGIGLTWLGKPVIEVPGAESLRIIPDLAGVATYASWTRDDVSVFHALAQAERHIEAGQVLACREWLRAKGRGQVADLLAGIRDALRRTAPVILYRGHQPYTNLRDETNLTGKSLSPDHSGCALHGLEQTRIDNWSDDQTVLVACMALLTQSGGFHRVEECNAMQLNLRLVAELFLEKCRLYGNAGYTWDSDVAQLEPDPVTLERFAVQLRGARSELVKTRTLYRRISGPLLNKREHIANRYRGVTDRESAVLGYIREYLPLRARSSDEAMSELHNDASWLATPTATYGSGLEEFILRAVEGCVRAFSADFGLSRGVRSIPALIEAIRGEQWARLTSWELPEYFCCVVPADSTLSLFGGSWEAVADAVWAMSARMQYNSWHSLPGNLPRDPAVLARDFFKPPTMPDISSFSDQHHRGHVYNQVRFTIRCPQPVQVAELRLDALVDLRLVRCEGQPFNEEELCNAYRISQLIAAATERVAALVAGGDEVEVRAFDHVWHRVWVHRQLGRDRERSGDAGPVDRL